MVSDKRGGAQGGPGAGGGPRPVVTRPGSVNRGFASVDPERQREPIAEADEAAANGSGETDQAAARRTRAAQGRGARGRRADPGPGKGGGSA